MPNLIELSGLLNGSAGGVPMDDYRYQMSLLENLAQSNSVKGSKKRKGITAEKALEVAERLFLAKKAAAFLWARRAEKIAKAEGKSKIVKRAQEIIKAVRGAAVVTAMAALGDVDGIVLGRELGLW